MPYTKKLHLIRARVPARIKSHVRKLADNRGESESVIVREAVAFYLSALLHEPLARNPHIRQLLAELREDDQHD